MTAPRVAVLTPLRGHAEYLPAMLDSLQAQTMPDWECAIVLDGPDEHARAIAQGYADTDPRIAVYVFAHWQGLPSARNAAARATSAPWLLPFDADDVMDPELLQELLAAGDARLELGAVVFTPARCVWPDGRTEIFRYPPFNPARFADECQLTGAALRRRSLWEALGGLDEGWTMGAEDWHFYARAVARGLLVPVQLAQPRWTYRQHDGARNSRVGERAWHLLQPKLRAALHA